MLAVQVIISSLGCFRLDVDAAAEAAQLARSGTSSSALFCTAFGGLPACLNLCSSLESDHCWNSYLETLAADARFSDKLQSWILLQYARDSCVSTTQSLTCSDWMLLEPLAVPHLLEQLCAPQCLWTQLPPPAAAWINATLPQEVLSKELFCSSQHDNTFCAAAAASVRGTRLSGDDAHECDLLRNGCENYYLALQRSRMGAAAAAQRHSDLQPVCHLEQRLDNATLSLPPPIVTLSITPPPIATFPVGRVSRREAWAIIGGALGGDGNGSAALGESGGSGGSGGGGGTATGEGGAYFSRIEYNVTVGGAPFLVSGLMAEPVAAAPLRGIAMFFHGTRGPGDPAISHLPPVPASASAPCAGPEACERPVMLVQGEHTLVLTLTQLGYAVLCPDDLGLGVSQLHADQGYLNRDIVSAVALELLRGAQQHLLARPRRFRPGRVPELWLMGGSHGGYITAAMQWRLQEANNVLRDGERASLFRFVTTGSFMEAAPIDVSGNVLDQFTSTQPCAETAVERSVPPIAFLPCSFPLRPHAD